jgi:hypothetical protein
MKASWQSPHPAWKTNKLSPGVDKLLVVVRPAYAGEKFFKGRILHRQVTQMSLPTIQLVSHVPPKILALLSARHEAGKWDNLVSPEYFRRVDEQLDFR